MTVANNNQIQALLEQRAASARRTLQMLQYALDRFERNSQQVVPIRTKLTVRGLAEEAGVSKDTPLCRFRKGHPMSGEFRFPDVVARFHELRGRTCPVENPRNGKRPQDAEKERIRELTESLQDYKRKLLQHDCVLNTLDTESWNSGNVAGN